MTVRCTYCKQEVVRGEDTVMRKDGTFNGFHKSCQREMNALQIQYAHLLLGNTCMCCGSTENIQAGHINFPKDKIVKNKNTKNVFIRVTHDSPNNPKFLELIRTHAVIPVCSTCNCSMGNGSTCRVHRKYLGIWNYLLPLDDLEEESPAFSTPSNNRGKV